MTRILTQSHTLHCIPENTRWRATIRRSQEGDHYIELMIPRDAVTENIFSGSREQCVHIIETLFEEGSVACTQ